ncbi:Serine kinase [Aphanomyces cochlioides]|nr:Serine kinase [Aphanomyces cochlioides]
MNIKDEDIARFMLEIQSLKWGHMNIQFLDEVSFDNKGMLRNRGYSMKGQKLAFRDEFNRKPRVSLLCFINMDSLVETFSTDGTFDRTTFVDCCREHAHSGKSVRQYPGPGSIWILDGAKIHCHYDIVYYLRSLGIVPIFLPAYCPFYNPIEILFGLTKRAFKRKYWEGNNETLAEAVALILQDFYCFDMTRIFDHCGWKETGVFYPTGPLTHDTLSISGYTHSLEQLSDFREREDLDDENNVEVKNNNALIKATN